MSEIKRIGVMTAGGDCPGLNAVIRAVTKTAIQKYGLEVMGIKHGYRGLYLGGDEFINLDLHNVSGIISKGGTMLYSSNKDNLFDYTYVDEHGQEQHGDVSDVGVENLKKAGIDALIVMVDATAVGKHDDQIVEDMSRYEVKKALVLNKIDLLPKESLLALMQRYQAAGYDDIVPVSARTGDGLAQLRALLVSYLPEGPQYFPPDAVTDQPERLICAELIREKALLHLRDEVPHGIGVEMLAMKRRGDLMEIHATIYCERAAHKGIIIGKQGAMLRKIGAEARKDIEELLDTRVYLQLWVKVKEGWRNNQYQMRNFGYENE